MYGEQIVTNGGDLFNVSTKILKKQLYGNKSSRQLYKINTFKYFMLLVFF